MRSPLFVPRDELVNIPSKKAKPKKRVVEDDAARGEGHLTAKVRGGRSRYAMRRIIQSVARLQEIDTEVATNADKRMQEPSSVRGPWVRAERLPLYRREKRAMEVTDAEMTLDAEVLERLRREARGMRKWIRAKTRGVPEEVVEEIRRAWKGSELAMVKIVEPLSRNMDRAREIVEAKTGGLVVWSKKDILVVYRGVDFQATSKAVSGLDNEEYSIISRPEDFVLDRDQKFQYDGNRNFNMFSDLNEITGSLSGTLFERETERLLNGLGPRFIDWWMKKPLPVDADLLPEVVPDFKPPVRCCLPHVRANLTDEELTYLRKIARPLPTHFALGKNKKLQGLAAAITKLWEKCLIAKIAVKRGIPIANNEIMSSELKRLTGGTLILRNKFYIILYRGKDFLPPSAANSIIEREIELRNLQLKEEQSRESATVLSYSEDMQSGSSVVGTFMEFQDIQANHRFHQNDDLEKNVKLEAEKERLEKELSKQKHQLSILRLKIEHSEKVMEKLNLAWSPSAQEMDRELITEEERLKFRKIGVKMDEILLLGRRGIYDGVIGSIHMHWRHRELVKVVTMQNVLSRIIRTAQILENESGGILIAIENYKSGYAIIIYRGKNYRPPSKLTPENFPTKREALQRSIMVQRRGSLKFFAREREKSILALESKIRNLDEELKDSVAAQPKDDDRLQENCCQTRNLH